MGKSREIKGRIKAVKNIQRITRTMQMIATSKFSKAQQAAMAGRPYSDGLFDLVAQLAAQVSAGGDEAADHPLLREPEGDAPEVTLIITSDRGLCGPYNGNVLKLAMRHLREHPGARDGRVELRGKKGQAVLKFSRVEVAAFHDHIGDQPQYEDVEALARGYIEDFSAGAISGVRVVSMRYISAGRQVPEVRRLLPFSIDAAAAAAEDTPADAGPAAAFEFSPSAEELLGTLLPAAVKASLFQAFNDAVVSEHVARMVAMKAATDNAGKMRKKLSRVYNRARQAQITTELSEIISGAAALG